MIDEKLLKELLKKTDVVTYVWCNLRTNLRSSQYLNDADDRHSEFNYITDGRYKLSAGVHLYREIRHRLKLIAVVYEEEIKTYE